MTLQKTSFVNGSIAQPLRRMQERPGNRPQNLARSGMSGSKINHMDERARHLEDARQHMAAKAENVRRDMRLWELHRIASERLADDALGAQARLRAIHRVDLWESRGLCSSDYIAAWRQLLALDAASFRNEVLSDAPGMVALRQNTPFGFLLRE